MLDSRSLTPIVRSARNLNNLSLLTCLYFIRAGASINVRHLSTKITSQSFTIKEKNKAILSFVR